MPPKDYTRWKQNPDGSWSRNLGGSSYLEEGYIEQKSEPEQKEPAIAEELNATQGALQAAAALGIDLALVEGTGLNGRITKADVEAYATDN